MRDLFQGEPSKRYCLDCHAQIRGKHVCIAKLDQQQQQEKIVNELIGSDGHVYGKDELRAKFALPIPPYYGKCARCGSVTYMKNNRLPNGNRIYVCSNLRSCKANWEAPVSYFWCDLFSPEHGEIEEDTETQVCQLCVLPGVPIITDHGMIPIELVRPSDHVLAHDGLFHSVLSTHVRSYSGDICRFRVYGSPIETSVTLDHPIYKALVKEPYDTTKDVAGSTVAAQVALQVLDIDWVPAEKIQLRSVLMMPVIRETADIDVVMPKPPLTRKGSRHYLLQLFPISINDAFMTLSGFYLAEGSIVLKGGGGKTRGGAVALYFGRNLKEFLLARSAYDTAEELGFKPRLSTTRYGIRVSINSLMLAHFLVSTYGSGAHRKYIPAWILKLPNDKLEKLLRAYLYGDGSFVRVPKKSDFAWRASTVSFSLAMGIKMIAEKIGWRCSIAKWMDQNHRIEGRPVNTRMIYNLRLSDRPLTRTGNRLWRDSVYIYTRVMGRTVERYHGPVYNLNVEGAESFCAPNVTLHNCPVGKHWNWKNPVGECPFYAGQVKGEKIDDKQWFAPQRIVIKNKLGEVLREAQKSF